MTFKVLFLTYFIFAALNIDPYEAVRPILREVNYEESSEPLFVTEVNYNPLYKEYRSNDANKRLSYKEDDEADDAAELRRKMLALLILDAELDNPDSVKSETSSKELGVSRGEPIDSFSILNTLRKGVWSKCGRSASKLCFKACCDAATATCSLYSCKSRMKTKFRRNCKTYCNRRFST